jgi:hypothetical protein
VGFRVGDLFYVRRKKDDQEDKPVVVFYISGGGFHETGIGKSRKEGVHRVSLLYAEECEQEQYTTFGEILWEHLEARQNKRGGVSARWLFSLMRGSASGVFAETFAEYIPIAS